MRSGNRTNTKRLKQNKAMINKIIKLSGTDSNGS